MDIFILRLLKILMVLLGSVLVYLSAKSYRKHSRKEMLFVALGFILITVGSVLAGIFFEFLGFSLLNVNIAESLMVIIGFIFLIYSIYGFD